MTAAAERRRGLGPVAAHLLFAVFLACMAVATSAGPAPVDAVLEGRVRDVAVRLRCTVCQDRTIADADSGLAMDLKAEIRERLSAGETVAQVTEFMVARYGDFVHYKPPLKSITWLWAAPFVLLVGGLGALLVMLQRRRGGETRPPASVP